MALISPTTTRVIVLPNGELMMHRIEAKIGKNGVCDIRFSVCMSGWAELTCTRTDGSKTRYLTRDHPEASENQAAEDSPQSWRDRPPML